MTTLTTWGAIALTAATAWIDPIDYEPPPIPVWELAPLYLDVPDDVATLDEAVDRIADGGTITVTADLTEALVLSTDKQITLIGAAPGVTVFAPTDGDTVIDVADAAGVTLQDLTLAGGAVGVAIDNHVSTTLFGVTVRDAAVGVDVAAVPGKPERTTVLESCTILDSGEVGIQASESALWIGETTFDGNHTHLRTTDHTEVFLVHSTLTHEAGSAGSSIRESDQVLIEQCRVEQGLGRAGLRVLDSSRVDVVDSEFLRNLGAGLAIDASASVQILDSQFSFHHNASAWDHCGELLETTEPPEDGGEGPEPGEPEGLGGKLGKQLIREMRLPRWLWHALVLAWDGERARAPELTLPEGMEQWPSPREDDIRGVGLIVTDSANVAVDGVTVESNDSTGMVFREVEGLRIDDSAFFFNGWAGLILQQSDAEVRSSVFTDNTITAIWARCGRTIVEDSVLTRSWEHPCDGGWGYGFLADGGTHQLFGNLIWDHPLAGVAIYIEPPLCGDAHGQLCGNTIAHTEAGVVTGGGASVSGCAGVTPAWNDIDALLEQDNTFSDLGVFGVHEPSQDDPQPAPAPAIPDLY